jgi:hypothetical protein
MADKITILCIPTRDKSEMGKQTFIRSKPKWNSKTQSTYNCDVILISPALRYVSVTELSVPVSKCWIYGSCIRLSLLHSRFFNIYYSSVMLLFRLNTSSVAT